MRSVKTWMLWPIIAALLAAFSAPAIAKTIPATWGTSKATNGSTKMEDRMPGVETLIRREWSDSAPVFDYRDKGGHIRRVGAAYTIDRAGAVANVGYTSTSLSYRTFFSFRMTGLTVLEATLVVTIFDVSQIGSDVEVEVWAAANLIDDPSLGAAGASDEFNQTYTQQLGVIAIPQPGASHEFNVPVTLIPSVGFLDIRLNSSIESGLGVDSLIRFYTGETSSGFEPYMRMKVERVTFDPLGSVGDGQRDLRSSSGGVGGAVESGARDVTASDGSRSMGVGSGRRDVRLP